VTPAILASLDSVKSGPTTLQFRDDERLEHLATVVEPAHRHFGLRYVGYRHGESVDIKEIDLWNQAG
jgi:hypothetical protein